MDSVGHHPIRDYIGRRKSTIARKVACRPIYEIFVEAERIPGTNLMVRWWYQDVVNEPDD